MTSISHLLPVTALCAAIVAQTAAAEPLVDPGRACADILASPDEEGQMAHIAWAEGFIAARRGRASAVTRDSLRIRLDDLKTACAARAGATFSEIVTGLAGGDVAAARPAADPAPVEGFPATEAGARRLLERFFAAGADFVSLTAALRPGPDDYRAVYEEPFASALEGDHRRMWEARPGIRPNAGQTELLLFFTTTTELGKGGRALDIFPGGYKRVVQFMKPGIPIVRFKFVKPGAQLGLAFDGLVHVNGRWVLMPKPYRAL